MLKGEAAHWWETSHRIHRTEANPISWTHFKRIFFEKYFPSSMRPAKEIEFINLVQGYVIVTQYERQFEQLSRFAPHLVDIEECKVRKFEMGQKHELRYAIKVLKLTTYDEVLDRA